jgi:hypothetical protein
VSLHLPLHLEGRRRKREPAFRELSRAAARALAVRDLAPVAETLSRGAASAGDVVFASRIHGICGLLAELTDARPDAVPEELAIAWREDRARAAERAARLAEDLARLGERARRSGLAFVPLKGAVLAFSRGRDPSLRPCADLDLLASGADFDAWTRVLLEMGYVLETEGAKDSVFQNPKTRPPSSFAEDPDAPRPVELHRRIETRLLGRVHDPTESYLASLTDGTLLGVPARLPSDDALFLHLFLHASPDLVGRGLRLVQYDDFTHLKPTNAFVDAAIALLDEASWGIAALLTRTRPDAVPAALLGGFERAAPPARRRRAWLSRPGLLTGEAEKTVLVLAEARLCRRPGELAARARQALPDRAFLDRAYGAGVSLPLRLARYYRYYRDRLAL